MIEAELVVSAQSFQYFPTVVIPPTSLMQTSRTETELSLLSRPRRASSDPTSPRDCSVEQNRHRRDRSRCQGSKGIRVLGRRSSFGPAKASVAGTGEAICARDLSEAPEAVI